MNRELPAIFAILLVLQACHSEAPPALESAQTAAPTFDDEVVATVRGDKITRKDLEPVLEEAYGLNALLTLVQLDLVEQEAAKQGIIVTPADVVNERAITMKNLVRQTQALDSNGQPTTEPTDNLDPDQQNQLLDQLLQQQHVSRAEFSVILEVNAYLRKLAEPAVNAKLTDNAVRQLFNAMYGEKVLVHYIVCNNMAEAGEVHHDLAIGKSFEDVARARSLDRPTAYSGGELPAFTLQDNRFPPEFKQVAFELKKGEVSDPVQVAKFIYIIKLIDRIPPAHARFEDYRDSVKKDLYESTVQAAMKVMREKLGRMALESLTIRDPILAKQWADKITQKNGQVKDSEELRKELDSEHAPATIPSSPAPDHSTEIPPTSPAPAAAR